MFFTLYFVMKRGNKMWLFRSKKRLIKEMNELAKQKLLTEDNGELYTCLLDKIKIHLYILGKNYVDNIVKVENDSGLFKEFFVIHLIMPEFLKIRKLNFTTYLLKCSMDALGAGMCLYKMQKKYGKETNCFNQDEIMRMLLLWKKHNSYLTGLESIGISTQTKEAESYRSMCMGSVIEYQDKVMREQYKDENLYTLMKVMYSIGYSIALQKEVNKQ